MEDSWRLKPERCGSVRMIGRRCLTHEWGMYMYAYVGDVVICLCDMSKRYGSLMITLQVKKVCFWIYLTRENTLRT